MWRETDHYGSLDAWRQSGFADRFTAAGIENRLGVGDTSKDGKFILIWAIECRTAKEMENWSGELLIKVTDRKDGLPGNYRYGELPAALSFARPSREIDQPTIAGCQSNS